MSGKTLGIVGCGAIGSAICDYAEKNLSSFIGKIVLCDTDTSKVDSLKGKLNSPLVAESMEEVVSGSDLIIEAASPKVVPHLVKEAIQKGKDVMVMSIGGILGNENLLEEARKKRIKLMLPSGAIAGIDAIKSAKEAGLENVRITTRKAPRSIKGAPYLEEKGIDVEDIKEETVIFEGSALEAIKGFPKNVNVSALLSIAGIGPEKTRVRIVVSPEYTKNTHEIEAEGSAGKLFLRAENVPSPQNPKTSYLAVLAAITSLKGYFDSVRVGT